MRKIFNRSMSHLYHYGILNSPYYAFFLHFANPPFVFYLTEKSPSLVARNEKSSIPLIRFWYFLLLPMLPLNGKCHFVIRVSMPKTIVIFTVVYLPNLMSNIMNWSDLTCDWELHIRLESWICIFVGIFELGLLFPPFELGKKLYWRWTWCIWNN